ncbi:hypothetical protein DASC09_062790 [Saccharomycopsis crataegensis]|uniref:Uncharacterized protein n=1 Tax=Saccharomycopsis crataegensis TaxID=43959 RepID=A0AAV5QWE0_9ASCO|nr:hypothetical protein DASC09_062790 [Saccharomycopsis crataegensis]
MDDYGVLVDNVLKIRLKYLSNFTLACLIVPSLLLCQLSWKTSLLLYTLFTTICSIFILFRYAFLKKLINYNNSTLSYFNVKNALNLNAVSLTIYLISVVVSLFYFGVIGSLYFDDLHFLNQAKKHQKPTINSTFLYFYSCAIANGFFNGFYSLCHNEQILSIDFTRFHVTSKSLLQTYLDPKNLSKFLQNYLQSLLVFLAGLKCFLYFININQIVSSWASLVTNVDSYSRNSLFDVSVIFTLKIVIFSVVLKCLCYIVAYCVFNSYILLGGLHFGQLISNYSNVNNSQAVNFSLLFNGLKDTSKDRLIKITILQELGYMAVSKKPEFYGKFISYYGEFFNSVEHIVKANVDSLNSKMKIKVDEKKPPVKSLETLLKNDDKKVKINEKDMFKQNKTSFFWSTLDSISIKFVASLQDKESSESFGVIAFMRGKVAFLCKMWNHVKTIVLVYLNINSLEQNLQLIDAIQLYYYLSTFTLVVKNSHIDLKLNNKILSNIDQVLSLLQQSIQFSEQYMIYNKIDFDHVKLRDAKKKYYKPLHHQYTNQYLVLRIHKLLMTCFVELICKYSDILSELNVSPEVMKLSNKCFKDLEAQNKGGNQPSSSLDEGNGSILEHTMLEINL